ncbi:MAG: amidohydrolase family protein, partial [Actinomycetota bacterium]
MTATALARRFISITLIALPVHAFMAAAAAGGSAAERIFRGGPIVTVQRARPTAEAVAVAGGRIVAVGDEADVMRLVRPTTDVVDLAGRTLVPGFIDGHSHFFCCVDVQVQALCASPPAGPCTSVADVISQLQKLRERRHIGPGEFVIGYGYDPDLLAEKRPPTRRELDAAFPDNPVFIIHVSGHGAMLNSRALARFGVTAATPTPPGGEGICAKMGRKAVSKRRPV